MDELECFKCNNFRHKVSECRSKFEYPSKLQYDWDPNFFKRQEELETKDWENHGCRLAFSADDQENIWYVDSGFSNHMTRDKSKFLYLKEKYGGNNVIFRNNPLARIKGKGIVSLNEKTKDQNVLYVEAIKHNLLSVSQMCDNGYNVTFRSKDYEIR